MKSRRLNRQEDEQDYDSDGDSVSTFSLESLSDRSDLNPEDVERLVLQYYQRQNLSWKTLSIWEKLKLFKAWYLISMTGNLASIFGSTFVIFSDYFALGFSEIAIGFGAFCTWCSITKYLANTEELYVINRTFKKAIPTMMKIWLGILPIYIGVCFLSMAYMWEFSESFGTFSSGFYTMFSVQAGDALFDTWVSMKKADFFYAMAFMYGFIFFVVSFVQNIFMAVVEDAYISIKYEKNFEWLGSGHKHEDGNDQGPDNTPPPNQPAALPYSMDEVPEQVKKHFT